MESPVVLDKPPEYHGKDDRGFPFDEEEGSGAWSELASRHPDIAARLRQHPSTWARKRRPSNQDNDDFGESFTGFDRFPFDDIPPEFREHFPSHWNRRFGTREEAVPQPQTSQSPPQQHTAATQTEHHPPPETSGTQHTHLPQYGLRNTVDLGQKSAADPSLVDADDRNQRSMSAPPESRNTNHSAKMSGQNHQDSGSHAEQPQTQSKVRNIPIFVEGRDQPVINETVDHTPHFGEPKPTYVPQQPPLDSSYFTEEGPTTFHHPPNFSRSFGTPFGKPYRQGQPFAQQKVYPQSATSFARGASPQRSQSPKPQPHEEYIKVPVHHEPSAPKPQPQARPQQPKPQPSPQQQKPQPPQQQKPQPPPPQQAQPPPPQQPPKQPTPPPQPQSNDPITMILAIQTDVLNLMTEVENFTGTKKDKRYLFLDEMLTRNLIKLDNIETEGKENIRNARKEAIRCIEKCIAVLEAKAEKGSQLANQSGGDTEMNAAEQAAEQSEQKNVENGEVEEVKEPPTEEVKAEAEQPKQQSEETVVPPAENKETPQVTDTRPEENTQAGDVDKKPNKVTKNVKKDKSKDKANVDSKDEKSVEAMQFEDKGDNVMEVDGGASQN